MEVATLKKKKTTISKGKIKKTMKNVLCRPDPVFWPVVSEEHGKQLENGLLKFRVDVPEFKKPHWSDIKALPKEERPKAPKPKRVEGLLFGITTCARSIQSSSCNAIILDAEVNPRILVQHVIEAALTFQIPILCLRELKKITASHFGFPTSCLGIKKDENCMTDLRSLIADISKSYRVPKKAIVKDAPENTKMEIDEKINTKEDKSSTTFNYLYRTSTKSRVFTPPIDIMLGKKQQGFAGQDFIEFCGAQENEPMSNNKSYMNMIVKKYANNSNRKKN